MLLGKEAEDSIRLVLLRRLADFYREDMAHTERALEDARHDAERLEAKMAKLERLMAEVERDITEIEGEMRA